jgi:hypothetical protein
MCRRCCDWYCGVTLPRTIARPTMQMTDAMHHLAVGYSRGRGNRAAAAPTISSFDLEDARARQVGELVSPSFCLALRG